MAIAPLCDYEVPRPSLRLVEFDPRPASGATTVLNWENTQLGRNVGRPARHAVSARVRRRRLTLALVVSGAALALGLSATGGHGAGATAPGLPPNAAQVLPLNSAGGEGTFYVVQSGDTVASIASRVDPSNPRLIEHELVALLGSDVVVPGEHIAIS